MRLLRTIANSTLTRALTGGEWWLWLRSSGVRGLLCVLSMSHGFNISMLAVSLVSCEREPPLHLYDAQEIDTDLPLVDLDLEVFWDYELSFDVQYDWHAEWYYGWDEHDLEIFGELGYTEPTVFNLRRYYTGEVPNGPHTSVIAPPPFTGTHYQDRFDWGFWDVIVWNEIKTIDGVQSLIFDESSLDSITAHTNPSMHSSRYHAPRYTRSFYAPEPLFSAYDTGIEINRDLRGFVYDAERDVYVRKLDMFMYPLTYIYLTQVILHHNNGRITSAEGSANLSGMARSTNLTTSRAGCDPISVYYNCNLKNDCALVPYGTPADAPERATAEHADIIGGRLVSFGMCCQSPRKITSVADVTDVHKHYLDVNVQFYNGMDSTLVFDVTKQVRERYKGGVITVELDLDTVPIPKRSGGSGFDAVVKDFEDGGTHEFEM